MMISNYYYIRHDDVNLTGEGLGSHARGSLYPLLRVSLHFGWEILWHANEGAFGKNNQTRPSYQHELQYLGEWLFLDSSANDHDDDDNPNNNKHRKQQLTSFDDLDKNRLTVVNIDLENDVRLGRILGYAGILISSIEAYMETYGTDVFFNNATNVSSQSSIVLVSLNGRFQYQDDPSPPVVQWLQNKGQQWRRRTPVVNDESTGPKSKRSTLRVAAHIRVPEDYCSQEWKDANNISHILEALQVLQKQWSLKTKELQVEQIPLPTLEIFTEDVFSAEDEAALMQEIQSLQLFKTMPSGNCNERNTAISTNIQIHRQTPLLDTVQRMATADIFIPASSFLSGFAGFFHSAVVKYSFASSNIPSLILMPEERTRREKYFAPHLSYASNTRRTDAESRLGSVICPIVSHRDTNLIAAALESLLLFEKK